MSVFEEVEKITALRWAQFAEKVLLPVKGPRRNAREELPTLARQT